MPPEPAKNDAAELVRQLLRGLVRLLSWVVPIVLLIWLISTFRTTSNVTVAETPDAFMRAYGTWVGRFAASPDLVPTELDYKQWLRFFDEDSRDFFDSNVTRIMRRYYPQRESAFAGRSTDELRLEAMRAALGTAPLNGRFVIKRMAPRKEGGFVFNIEFSRREAEVVVGGDKNGWYILDLMGQKENLVGQIATVE